MRFYIWFIFTVYYKMQQILLQNATAILLQNTTEVYYKMRPVFFLQNVTFITKYDNFIIKSDVYYKLWKFAALSFYWLLRHPAFFYLPPSPCPSLSSTCVTYRASFCSIGHQVIPASSPREAENFPWGDKYPKVVPLPTCLHYFQPV